MSESVLFGTASQAKLDHVRALVDQLPVQVLSPRDVGITLSVEENGETAEANARIKARAYCDAAAMPAFAIDAGLTIDAFPAEWQPGVYVRRVLRNHEQHSDREILEHYVEQLRHIGGDSTGRWHVAIALALPAKFIHQASVRQVSYQIETRFSARPSRVVIDDAPLSSLMLDPLSGMYYSEMTYAERPDTVQLKQGLLALFKHLATWNGIDVDPAS